MMLNKRVRSLAVALTASAVLAFSLPALAQDISDAHLKAGREAVAALRATDPFDTILPQAAAALQQQLIQKNPDMEQLITTTVSEKALALASRRADLEKEAAMAYAKSFSEEELNSIAAFYSSPAGKKLLETGPLAMRELLKAAEIWQNGIARDLAEEVGKSLAAAAQAKAPAEGTTPPAEGGATEGAAPANNGG